MDSEDIEEETEEEVDKVLNELAGETAAQLPEAARKERIKLPAQKASASKQVCKTLKSSLHYLSRSKELNLIFVSFCLSCFQEEAVAEGIDDEEEMEELRARLAKVRS